MRERLIKLNHIFNIYVTILLFYVMTPAQLIWPEQPISNNFSKQILYIAFKNLKDLFNINE